MTLDLAVEYAAARRMAPARASLARWARAALSGARRKRVALGIRIVGRAESATLNARYRARRGPTNVLSFSFDAPPGVRSDFLGDLVICAPIVQAEARRNGITARAHWAHMVVHGILHLRGYVHEDDHDAEVMEDREARVLKRLGFDNPYRPSPPSAP